ncbi:hypothetical protein J8273_7957 [Carpediemonas membranifera]|uniref:NlpC/P60 domain-containing protein n=1 Tax=Carpediemonas membranifera TaxID=201153 RepID=A0A8J6BUQ7_9EUKA|nr:hypothetical protein J8273_7957 [Carpediemonas membranifera]|eukprot:KAG9390606.1 hypothetical protein J8273_7957 [Carpediemonas membranifera]
MPQSEQVSLQDAFKKFQAKKKTEFKLRYGENNAEGPIRSEEQKDALRHKFVDQLMKYQGVPYAKRFHGPDSPFYDAPLFLDCCGLVRKAMDDLAEDFGFTIGRWNQAYMFDTLPDAADSHRDLKPGDLIFYEGTYVKENMKRQKHNIVHIEVYLGDPADADSKRCIGSRWHKKTVTVFDSFEFMSTSWRCDRIWFKSIDPWLCGRCVSHCPDHSWAVTDLWSKDTKHLRRSIFMELEGELTMQESMDAEVGGSYEDDE